MPPIANATATEYGEHTRFRSDPDTRLRKDAGEAGGNAVVGAMMAISGNHPLVK
jgi:hypothetical protein